MGSRRTTFGKTQRERDKRAKAAAKRERRIAGSAPTDEPEAPPEPAPSKQDQEAVLTELAALHERFADGGMELEEFEARRDELRGRLQIT